MTNVSRDDGDLGHGMTYVDHILETPEGSGDWAKEDTLEQARLADCDFEEFLVDDHELRVVSALRIISMEVMQ